MMGDYVYRTYNPARITEVFLKTCSEQTDPHVLHFTDFDSRQHCAFSC